MIRYNIKDLLKIICFMGLVNKRGKTTNLTELIKRDLSKMEFYFGKTQIIKFMNIMVILIQTANLKVKVKPNLFRNSS
jgi:hypothetical protein